ncbi:hypothetical protein RRG08_054508 [Elysia crispata]|uniref:Uncharacterized protein n=1 Tax=Elysia crispata TaxID=231223 RepID=A0AAE1D4R2_9GAST|nr:hypothetical protein RRG08_054508 [Elysia crispata]
MQESHDDPDIPRNYSKSGQKLAQYQLSASTVGVSCVNVATGIEVLIVLTFQLTGHGRMTSWKTVTDSGQDSHGGTHTNYDTHNPYTLPQPERVDANQDLFCIVTKLPKYSQFKTPWEIYKACKLGGAESIVVSGEVSGFHTGPQLPARPNFAIYKHNINLDMGRIHR